MVSWDSVSLFHHIGRRDIGEIRQLLKEGSSEFLTLTFSPSWKAQNLDIILLQAVLCIVRLCHQHLDCVLEHLQ